MSGFQDPPEAQCLTVCKEEVHPEQQEWSSSLNQEITESLYIKVEPEKLEGEQLQELEEDDVIKFTFFPDPGKSEDGEETPQSSQLHQRQTEQMKTGADGEDCIPEAMRYFDPERDLQPETRVKMEYSSDPETDDSTDWRETEEDQSGLNSVENITQKRKKNENKSHSCPECGKTVKYMRHLTDHMRIHTGEKPFSCSECGKRFTHKASMTLHRRIHKGEKPFSCSECDQKFTQNAHLTVHMRIHTGEKPFVCSECGKRFNRETCMARHMVVHTREKPFTCSECGKSFTQKGSVTAHMIIHKGEKPFNCSECGQKFTRKGSMTEHMKIHRAQQPLISCLECGKSFTRKGSLNAHMRIHNGEKPFSCFECGKRFSRKVIMTKHTRIHKGENPFSCSECGKMFNLRCGLTAHMAHLHTGDKPFSSSFNVEKFEKDPHLKPDMPHHRGTDSFDCTVCAQKFALLYQLRLHTCVGNHASEPLQNQTGGTKEDETGADGEDCRGSEAGSYLDPEKNLHPKIEVKTEEFSKPESEDSFHWKENEEHQYNLASANL